MTTAASTSPKIIFEKKNFSFSLYDCHLSFAYEVKVCHQKNVRNIQMRIPFCK